MDARADPWQNAEDVSLQNEKLHKSQRINTFHTPRKLERRTPETERPGSTPMSDQSKDPQYGLRLADLVNNWNEDTRRMLREELASTRPVPPSRPQEDITPQILQLILLELQSMAPLPHCDHCGALARVAGMQEDLVEIVKGHLLMEKRGETSSELQALPSLLPELISAFGEMQNALKGSAELVAELKKTPPRSEPIGEPLPSPGQLPCEWGEDLQQIKEFLGTKTAAESLLCTEVQGLKEALKEVQQKAEKDSQVLLSSMQRLSDVVAASDRGESMAMEQNQKLIMETLQQVTELVAVDHGRQREESAELKSSVQGLDAQLAKSKSSLAAAVQQSNQDLAQRMAELEVAVTSSHQEAEQRAAERLDAAQQKVEHIDRQAELHSSAVDELKQELEMVKQVVAQCHERLVRMPRQVDLAEAVKRSFEQMSKDFHQECAQLYMKPSFQVSFPETLNHDLQAIKDAIHEEKQGREDTQARSVVELSRLEQEIQKTEQGMMGLEGAVKSQVAELQHLQDIFAMLEANFLTTVRKELDKATSAFSSTTAQFRSSVKKDLEALKDSQAAPSPAAYTEEEEVPRLGPRVIEFVCVFFTLVEFVMQMSNAFLELEHSERFFWALAAVLGPCLLNAVLVMLWVSFLAHGLARWMKNNWRHSQGLLAMAVLRPEWLRFFGLHCPPLRSVPGPWERRYWEEILRIKNAQMQKECDELRLALQKSQEPKEEPQVLEDAEEESHPLRLQKEASHGAAEGVTELVQRHPENPMSPRGPISVLRNREWDDWLRLQSRQEGETASKQMLSSGLRKVYAVVPEEAAEGVRPRARELPHSCMLCGLAPQALERKGILLYRKVLCLAILTSTLYSDVPKVVLCIWLLPQNSSTESWLLRIAILSVNGLYILWAMFFALSTWLISPPKQSPASGIAGLKDATIEVAEDSLVVKWSDPVLPPEAPEPDEFVCSLQQLGQSEPSMLRRVPRGTSSCSFESLQPDWPYIVQLAPAQKGVLLGRPTRISCRTLPRALRVEPKSLALRRLGPSWAEIAWAGSVDVVVQLAGDGLERCELAPGPVHCLWGLRPNTEYEVGVKLPGDRREPSLKLSFVTAVDDGPQILAPLTTLLKDLSSIKETVSSLDAACASAEVARQLGGLQERWASLQVSHVTTEVQRLMDSNERLKSEICEELRPMRTELRGLRDAIL